MLSVTSCKNSLLYFEDFYSPGSSNALWLKKSKIISDLHHCLEHGHLFAHTDHERSRHEHIHRNLQDLERELAVIREARQLIERVIMRREAEDETKRHDNSHLRVPGG